MVTVLMIPEINNINENDSFIYFRWKLQCNPAIDFLLAELSVDLFRVKNDPNEQEQTEQP